MENCCKNNTTPDSFEQTNSDEDQSYYKSYKNNTATIKQRRNRDCIIYNHTTRYNDSDSSESADSEDTLEAVRYDSCKSVDNLKTWRSFDSLIVNCSSTHKSLKEKISSENLSEDSGYSDHLCNYMKNRSSSIPNINQMTKNSTKSPECKEKNRNKTFNTDSMAAEVQTRNKSKSGPSVDFSAYDGNVFQNSTWCFGISFQDLSVVEDLIIEHRTPLINRFLRNGVTKQRNAANRNPIFVREVDNVNLERTPECARSSKYNNASASEPNLLRSASISQTVCLIHQHPPKTRADVKKCYLNNKICVSSVPVDLNLSAEAKHAADLWKSSSNCPSIAEKNWDIADISGEARDINRCTTETDNHVRTKMTEAVKRFVNTPEKLKRSSSISSESDIDMASFKREGSYMEAMSNMFDLSDDERNPCYSDHTPRSTIVEFDRQILKAISETSIKTFCDSNSKLDMLFATAPLSENKRNVVSTPNLTMLKKDSGRNTVDSIEHSSSVRDIARKSSLMNISTSTSGVSDAEEKMLTSTKSFSGSTNSKGVHFSPVVSEVNWRDDSNSPERESSYSLSSTPEKEIVRELTPPIIRPKPRIPTSANARAYASHSDLPNIQHTRYENAGKVMERDDTFLPLQPKQAVSQPNLNRRRSSLIHKDLDGSVIKAYTARDGVMYKHTHLSLNSSTVYHTSPTQASHVVDSNSTTEVNSPKPVRSMESEVTQRNIKSTRSGKLGGFFSRIASFRFANRKNDDKSKKKKAGATNASAVSIPAQRLATKEDYIYIPLKGPEKTPSIINFSKVQVDGRVLTDDVACISAKPPLPKVPPRVVGASVKRRPETAAQSGNPEERTIDSGDALPRHMEPMGLIETDLDTEVTVITSGTHAKTRSLMNLGAEAPPLCLVAPSHPSRPHKSMEFLLDKQNLKVVEVSSFLLSLN